MTIDDKFAELVKSNVGCVVILAGSGSDKPHIDKIVGGLEKYGIPYEVRVCSAHNQSEEVPKVIKEYDDLEGALGYVAVAGGSDALSGTASFRSLRVVISCPPDNPNSSALTNPPGSSNAYIARAENVGRFFAQMFSDINQSYRHALVSEVNRKISALENDDNKLRTQYAQKQGR